MYERLPGRGFYNPYKERTQTLVCAMCGDEFERPTYIVAYDSKRRKRCYCTPECCREHQKDLAKLKAPPVFGVQTLSAVELRCCQLAAGGFDDPEVTERSGVPYANVRYHLKVAFRKLQINNRVELLTFFPEVSERAAPRLTPIQTLVLSTLSQKERDILSRLANGELDKQIAYANNITEHTVKSRIKGIRAKLRMLRQSRVSLALLWREYLSHDQEQKAADGTHGADGHPVGVLAER